MRKSKACDRIGEATQNVHRRTRVTYGTDAPCVRFSFAALWEKLETAAKRIAEAMEALK